MMGPVPGLDIPVMLGAMMGGAVTMGRIALFLIGIVAWLGMMIVVMPMAGAGFFGMSFDIMAPVMTLILRIIFGAVLGLTHQKLATPQLAHS